MRALKRGKEFHQHMLLFVASSRVSVIARCADLLMRKGALSRGERAVIEKPLGPEYERVRERGRVANQMFFQSSGH